MATNNEIVQLVIDAKNLSSDEIAKAIKHVQGLGKAALKADAELDELKVDQDNLNSYAALNQKTDELTQKADEAAVAYKVLSKELKRNKTAIEVATPALEKSKRARQASQVALTTHNKELARLSGLLKKSNIDLDNTSKSQEKLKTRIAESTITAKGLNAVLKKQTAITKEKVLAERSAVAEANKRLALSKKQVKAMQEEYAADIKKVEANAQLAAQLKKYEVRLDAINDARRNGFVSAEKAIRLEEKLRVKLGLTEQQIKVSIKALAARNRALDKTIKATEKAARAEEKRAKEAKDSAQADAEATAETKRVTQALVEYRLELLKLNAQLDKGKLSKAQYINSEFKLRKSLKLTEQQAKATRLALAAESGVAKKRKSTDLLTTSTRRLAQAYTVLLAAQKAIQVVGSGVKEYGELEAAMVKVEKTTDLTKDQLISMTETLQKMSSEVTPEATNELLRYAEVAGQLGAEGTEDILRIASAADVLNVSTNLAGDEAVTLLTRMLQMTGEGVPAIHNLSSSMVELGNNTAATEAEIAHMTKEVITGTTAINLGSSASAAFGATLKENGQQAERSRSAMFKMSQMIKEASIKGGDDLQRLSDITGMTADAIEQNLGDRPETVLLAFVKGLKGIKDEGGLVSDSLNELGINGVEATSVIEILADNSKRLARNIELSNTAYQDGTKHIQEASKAYATQDAKVARLINKFTELKTKVGEAFSDELNSGIDGINTLLNEQTGTVVELVNYVGDMTEGMYEALTSLEAFAESFGLLTAGSVALSAIKVAINAIATGLDVITASLLEVRIAWAEWTDASKEEIQSLVDKQDKAFRSMEGNIQDIQDAEADWAGTSNSTYRDLQENAEKYKDALHLLTAQQRAELEISIKAGAFKEEHTLSYSKLTAQIIAAQRELEVSNAMLEANTLAASKNSEEIEQSIKIKAELSESLKGNSDEIALVNDRISLLDESLALGLITEARYRSELQLLESEFKAVASTTDKVVIEQDLLNEAFGHSTDIILDMVNSVSKYKLEVKTLRAELDKSSKGTELYEKTLLKLQSAKEKLARTEKDLQTIRSLENKTLQELILIQQQHKIELDKIDQKYASGAITYQQHAEAIENLKLKTDFLNRAVGESSETTQVNTDAIEENTSAVDDNSDALDRNTDVQEKGLEQNKETVKAQSIWLMAQHELTKELDYSADTTDDLKDALVGLDKQYKILRPTVGGWWDDIKLMNNQAVRRQQDTIKQTLVLRDYVAEVESGSLSLRQLDNMSRRADHSFKLLGDNQLEPLRNAIAEAKREFQDLSDTINDSFADVEDRLDALLGNEKAIVKRKFEREMQELLDLLEAARESGDRGLISKINEAIAKLKQAQKLEFKEQFSESSNSSKSTQNKNQNSGSNNYTVTIKTPDGGSTAVQVGTASDANSLIDTLAMFGEVSAGND